jgi:hypothetical protein
MSQPTPTYTDGDFERTLARDFPTALHAHVRALLDSYGMEEWHREALRVRMACLKCANGNMDRLREMIGLACADYRDALSAAEYRHYSRARTDAEKRTAISKDWAELQTWLKRT